MNLKTAIEILENHNRWRRGNEDMIMQSPTLIGKAIDKVVKESKKLLDKS